MNKKIIYIIVGLIIIFMFYLQYFNAISIYNEEKYFNNTKQLTLEDLKPGDILFRRSPFFDFLQPGYFTHSGIYYGLNDENINIVAESFLLNGVRESSLEEFLKNPVIVGRVNELNKNKLNSLLLWTKRKTGLLFALNAFKKETESNEYYCSEFVWAGFMSIGIDLDSDSFADFTVTPQELYDSNYLTIIGILNKENLYAN